MKSLFLTILILLSACTINKNNADIRTTQRNQLRIVLEPGVPFDGCFLRKATLYDPENLGLCDPDSSPLFDRPARTALLRR
jgi:hypothetical protein